MFFYSIYIHIESLVTHGDQDSERDKDLIGEAFEQLPEKEAVALKAEQDAKRHKDMETQGKILFRQRGFMVDLSGMRADAFRSL